VAQVVYYFAAYFRATGSAGGKVSFAVPSGNFGNILGGWYAKRAGASIERLVIASNRNDILARWVERGELVAETVEPTLSPSMDIQVSSNHERLLFELLGRDGRATRELLHRFRHLGSVEAPTSPEFLAGRASDDETLAEIATTAAEHDYLTDPHTAVGLHVARRLDLGRDRPVVCLATAHPAKFPDAVERATGVRPALPERLADLLERPEHYDVLPADLGAVRDHVRSVTAS
jgi:threonine synthase